MKTMPCLLNRWHDHTWDYGGQYTEDLYRGWAPKLAYAKAVARLYTEQLRDAGLGWMGWALREGKAISTRRDRYDGNGLDGQGFHPFFTRDGKLRPGLEFMTEPPAIPPPWTKGV